MKSIKQTILSMAIVFSIAGCGDSDLFRFDKMGKIEGWEPDFSLSLAHASFSIWDAYNHGVMDSTTLKKDANGQLYVECGKPDIYTLDVDSIYRMHLEDMFFTFSFPIKPKHFEDGSGTADKPHRDTLKDVFHLNNVPEGVYLEDAIVSIESMGVTIVNNAKIGGSLKITCKNLYTLQPAGVVSFTLNFTANDRYVSFSTKLPSIQAVMDRKTIVPIEAALTVTDISQANMEENIMVSMLATGVDNKSANLVLPEKEFHVDMGAFKPDVELLNKLSGKFRFSNPVLSLNAKTKGLGMKFALDGMQFTGCSAEETVTLQKNDGHFEFSGSKDNLYYKDNLLNYTTENSNVADFAALPPRDSIIYFGGKVKCGGETIALSAGGKMQFDLSMRFPLEMSATELLFCDTIAGINFTDSDKIRQAALKIVGTNALKMNVHLTELELLDENRSYLDRVKNENTESFGAATDQGPTLGSVKVELSEDNLQNLSKTKYIVLKLLLKTANGATVSFDDSSRFDLKFMLDVKVNMGDVIN